MNPCELSYILLLIITEINYCKKMAQPDNLDQPLCGRQAHWEYSNLQKKIIILIVFFEKGRPIRTICRVRLLSWNPTVQKAGSFGWTRLSTKKEIVIRTINFATGRFIWINRIICKKDCRTGFPFFVTHLDGTEHLELVLLYLPLCILMRLNVRQLCLNL